MAHVAVSAGRGVRFLTVMPYGRLGSPCHVVLWGVAGWDSAGVVWE